MKRTILTFFCAAISAAPASGADVWFELYSSDAGAGPAALRPRTKEGPFPDVVICYVIGALAMDVLAEVRPERDYRGRCADGDLLTFREMTDRAMALLPKQPNGEK